MTKIRKMIKRRILTSKFCTKALSLLLAVAAFCAFHADSEAASVQEAVYTEVCSFNPDPSQSEWIYEAIMYASAMYSVDPLLFTALIEQESGFNIGAVSSAGAVGLTQLMPSTANAVGVDPYNPLENVLGGAKHLRTLLNSFDNGPYGVTNSLAAYNAGSQAVIDYGGCPPYGETVNYVCSIASIYDHLLSKVYY